jgi:hypothetical protein
MFFLHLEISSKNKNSSLGSVGITVRLHYEEYLQYAIQNGQTFQFKIQKVISSSIG